jgi:DNA-binding NtrC family response regulator
MALPTQAKILRVLQEREVTPLGARHSQPVDLRIVAATHRDLEAEVAAGTFRADLWYRLQVITIMLPPLRERAGDVTLLAAHFLRGRAGGHAKRLSEPALRALEAHDWPGNVRELRNTIQRAVALSEGDLIEIEHLGLGAARQGGGATTLAIAGTDIDWDGTLERALAQVELAMLRRALDAAAGNRSEAARRLGLSRQQLYRKLAQYQME